MYLIDNSYFIGKYEIPDIDESQSGVSDVLNQFIDIEVRLFMQDLLGIELFKEFDNYIKPYISLPIVLPRPEHPAILPDPNQKWSDLINGKEYKDANGNPKKWNGLVYKIGNYPKSLLTNYIWCAYFMQKNRIDGNGNANVISSKNALLGNAANQYFMIWNEFVLMTTSWRDTEFVSLNQFLFDNPTDYPTTNFIHVDFQNRFL